MTPKEKAEELCYLYQGDFEKDTLNMSWTMAKKCALIAVDEILNKVMMWWELPCKDPYFITQKTYWEEVKNEIQKL